MTVYNYKAIDKAGDSHTGMLEAAGPQALRQQLRARGLALVSSRETARHLRFLPQRSQSVFSTAALTVFTRKLAILLEGGLQLEKALQLVDMQTDNIKQRARIHAVRGQIVEGASFSAALSAYPDDFPEMYRAAIAAGERVGDIGGVLNKLAEHGETHLRILGKVKLAMMYPLILAAFALLVVIGMMVYVFPDITRAFVQSGQHLPMLTIILMAISDGLRQYGLFLLLLIVLGVVMAKRALDRPDIRLKVDRRLLQLPILGRLVTAINMARFTGTLSMLSSSGVPLAEALPIAAEVLSNRWFKQAAVKATHRVIEGTSLSQALVQTECFPPAFISMVAGGEASGELERVFVLSAKNEIKELENRMLFGVALLEPVIILSLGLMVLLIVLAIMMPILSMNQLVK